MWLVPSSFVVDPGELVSVGLMVGHRDQAETVARDSRRIVRFQQVGLGSGAVASPGSTESSTPGLADTQPASDVPGLDGREPLGHLRPVTAGARALVYESTAALSELPPAAFEAYLLEEGLDTVQAERQRLGEDGLPGRELYSRSLKSLIQVGPGTTRVDRPVGLPLELVLEDVDPDVVLRLRWRGEPLAGVLVDLIRLDGPLAGGPGDHAARPRSLRSGPDGSLRVSLGAGSWLASCVHAERATGDEALRAEWRTIFASLTFAVEDP